MNGCFLNVIIFKQQVHIGFLQSNISEKSLISQKGTYYEILVSVKLQGSTLFFNAKTTLSLIFSREFYKIRLKKFRKSSSSVFMLPHKVHGTFVKTASAAAIRSSLTYFSQIFQSIPPENVRTTLCF